jgi:hypothetical protein
VELYIDGKGFAVNPARPPGYDRPWSPAHVTPKQITRPGLRTPDATPRGEDLQPDD